MTEPLASQFAVQLARDICTHPFEKTVTFAVAVSGGADSFALLHLAIHWARQNNANIIALTVDHRLRADSTAEAQHVALWCRTHNIPHHILSWTEEKPTSAIQDKARKIRRELLLSFCHRHRINYLLLGHQINDQAETFLMRLQRGSGVTGLSCMCSVTVDPVYAIQVLRPLLFSRRHDLRRYCLAHDVPFIDDPSNENEDFERVRMRKILHDLPAEFSEEITDGISLAAQRLQRAEQALDIIASEWLHRHMHSVDQDMFWIPFENFISCPEEIRVRILLRLVTLLTGNTRPSLSDMEDWSYHLAKTGTKGMNIAGCWARPKTIKTVQGIAFQREPARKKA